MVKHNVFDHFMGLERKEVIKQSIKLLLETEKYYEESDKDLVIRLLHSKSFRKICFNQLSASVALI